MQTPAPAASMRAWQREGLMLAPPESHGWWATHAQAPTILPMPDGLWRVYFGAREKQPLSRILCADIDPQDGFRVVKVHPDPVLDLGRPGTFDSHGMGPATALMIDGRVHLYYTGIRKSVDIPYQLAIGLAVSDDGLSFRRATPGPILSTGPLDPLFTSTPCVRRMAGQFAICYMSGVDWRVVDGAMESFYSLRQSRSDDGLLWDPGTSHLVGEGSDPDAGYARPWIEGDTLWYSKRGASQFRSPGEASYHLWEGRLSQDGACLETAVPLTFLNPPRAGDWDGWMQAYSCVIPWRDDLVMLYNGNDFGRGGFGRAVLKGGARAHRASLAQERAA